MGRACPLAQSAADILAGRAAGHRSTATFRSSASRDLTAINLHALMHPATNAELYGRVLCGMEPNTLYI